MSKPRSPLTLAVLISGGGRTLVNLQERIVAGTLNARIATVISSRVDVAGVQRARDVGLDPIVIERKGLDDEAFQTALTAAVGNADLVCMAGFLSLWRIPNEMIGRVINIHPALLPDFGGHGMYGMKVHRAVLEAGKEESGCTVHFCDNIYDHGPILLQRKVPVLPSDTADDLAERVFGAECEAYPEAINLIAAGRVSIANGNITVADAPAG